ncbi:glycoside hydrolase family 16 protein [Vibrio parahaemolyticus]|nr:glycoside hydrolase family 16 protein [Vibrio parahaemolyticus]
MSETLEGLPPSHFHSNDATWVNGKQYISVNVGTAENPQYEYREVLRRWICNNNRWYLAYVKDELMQSEVTLDNARYFNGAPYRGDVVIFGNGLKELPDPTALFTGSLYKMYGNFADTTENYVSFALEGEGVPFGLDGVQRICTLRNENSQYVRTVTQSGSEGYNWGCGAFLGTVPSNIYPNIWSLQFRLNEFEAGQDVQWLLYSGSKPTSIDDIGGGTLNHIAAFGAYVNSSAELVYFRRFNDDYVESRLQLSALDGWHQVQVEQGSDHSCTITIDKGLPSEKSGSCSLGMIGKEFDDVLFNCGPTVTDGRPSGDVYDRTWVGNIDIRRFYVDTNPSFDDSITPNYYEQPRLILQYRKDGSELFIDVSEYLVNWPHEQENRRAIYTLPDIEDGQYYVSYESNYGVSNEIPVYIASDIARTTELYTDFSNLTKMREEWLVAHKQWGGTGVVGSERVLLNGGVVRDNVEAYPYYKDDLNGVNGVLRLKGNGTFYDGPIVGVDGMGNPAPDGRKTEVGSAIVTKDYLGPGSYRCKIRAPFKKGACAAMWTFHYEEIYENDKRWDSFIAEGLHPQGTEEDGFHLVRNHEIDIELPTALKDATDMEDVSAANARLNTWIGELRAWDLDESDPNYFSEYTDAFENWVSEALSDGKWHEIGFDWHTNDPSPPEGKPAKRVDFYVDGEVKWTNETHVPDIPGRLWLAIWYPRAYGNRWAGAYADYIYDSIDIDYFHFIPFNEEVRNVGETFPDDVWRDWNWDNFFEGNETELPLPFDVPPPYENDVIPKLPDGSWDTANYSLAGANPPAYISPYRLEFRNDRKNYTVGAGECIILGLTVGSSYTITVNVVRTTNDAGGVEIVTFVAGNDVIPVDTTEGTVHSETFVAQSAGKVVVRRNKTLNKYEGLIDVKIEEAVI